MNNRADKILTRSEIAVVVAELRRKARRSHNTLQNLVIFRLATCCGLRVSELIGLRLSDVRVGLARPYLNIPRAIANGGKARRVALLLEYRRCWIPCRSGRTADVVCGPVLSVPCDLAAAE